MFLYHMTSKRHTPNMIQPERLHADTKLLLFFTICLLGKIPTKVPVKISFKDDSS